MAGVLDSKARLRRGLAFEESRHSTLRPLCGDLVLGHCRRRFASAGHILEALNASVSI